MSYGGSHQFNGVNWISYPYDFLVIILASLAFYYWGVKSARIFPDFYQAKSLNDTVKVEDDN